MKEGREKAIDASSKVWTVSNAVTLVRPILAIPIVAYILKSGGEPSLGIVFLFILGGISDAFDGYLARRRNEITELGTMLDPVADKVFGTAIFAALAYTGLLPMWSFLVLLIKELVLLLGGVLLLGRGARTISARPLGKIATVILFISFGIVLAGFPAVGRFLSVAGVLMSVAAGIDYAVVAMRHRNISFVRGDD